MSEVYLAISGAPDKLLGHVDEDGIVTRSRPGLDEVIGHVDLATGHVRQRRLGPDKNAGDVDLGSGKVYASRLGPDEYVGQVKPDGSLHRHATLQADGYIGKVSRFVSYAHSAAAMLLLVLPAIEEDRPTGEDKSAGGSAKDAPA
jgi:hypothetical protein